MLSRRPASLASALRKRVPTSTGRCLGRHCERPGKKWPPPIGKFKFQMIERQVGRRGGAKLAASAMDPTTELTSLSAGRTEQELTRPANGLSQGRLIDAQEAS